MTDFEDYWVIGFITIIVVSSLTLALSKVNLYELLGVVSAIVLFVFIPALIGYIVMKIENFLVWTLYKINKIKRQI